MGRLFQSKGQVLDFRGSWNLFKWWFGISWGCAFVGSGAIVLVEAPAIAAVSMLIGAWLLWFVGLRIPPGAGMWKDRADTSLKVCYVRSDLHEQQSGELAEARRQLGVWAPIHATLCQFESDLLKIRALLPEPVAADCLSRMDKLLTAMAETLAYLCENRPHG